jgi:photosystem II stability/assembly factor-like uncharacterized protein
MNIKTKHLVFAAIVSFSLTAQSCGLLGVGGGTGPRGIWKSADGGQNWQKVNTVKATPQAQGKSLTTLDDTDVRALYIAPDRTDVMYMTSTTGVFATEDAGQSWYHVLKNVNAISLDIAPTDPNIIYVGGEAGGRGSVYKSLNRGKDWEQKYIDVTTNPINAVAINPVDPKDILAGFNSGLILQSKDAGATWNISATLNGQIRQMRFSSRDPRSLYILVTGEGLFVSRDRGANVTPLTNTLEGGSNFSLDFSERDNYVRNPNVSPSNYINFKISQTGPETIYLTTDAGVYMAPVNAPRWSRIRLPLEPSDAKTVAVEPVGDGRIMYVSIDGIIYRSENGGTTFNTIKIPTERTIKYIISLPGDANTVYIGTTG